MLTLVWFPVVESDVCSGLWRAGKRFAQSFNFEKRVRQLWGAVMNEDGIILDKKESEKEVAACLKDILASHFSGYLAETGKSILYKIEVDALGQVTHASPDSPMRGQYAFQTDILITKASLPLVVIELKVGAFTTHDVITYSWKAQRHKQVYPYLRYGFVVVGLDALGRRFTTHNEGFDFAMALPNVKAAQTDLVPLVQRQITSAERLSGLMQSGRGKFRRYEEIVEIDR